ncbi:SMI1/KNR4 family protein [Draconibacterium sediminis]|uniref:SMI1/KNR4 family protein n=1 Tax=Draconibacterium sediminis TaxID=1544798 RepID=UPI0026EAEF8D|nr:SMI1/KNR4 family protein [Draconibacterium sediminis]
MVNFINTEKRIELQEINQLEKLVGLNFPNEYKQHLLKYNGGQCIPNVFSFKEDGIETKSMIDWFLAIYEGEYDNLKSYLTTFKIEEKRMPSHMIPIAHDPLGNLICISCSPYDYGNIYFWDHEKEVNYGISGNEDYSNLIQIANSFNEFISLLKDE